MKILNTLLASKVSTCAAGYQGTSTFFTHFPCLTPLWMGRPMQDLTFTFLTTFTCLTTFTFLTTFTNHFHFVNPLSMGQLAAPMQDFLIPPFLSLPTFNGAFSLSGAELHCHFVTLLSLSSSTFTFSLHFQLGHFPTETNGDFNFHFFTQLSKILLFGIYIGTFWSCPLLIWRILPWNSTVCFIAKKIPISLRFPSHSLQLESFRFKDWLTSPYFSLSQGESPCRLGCNVYSDQQVTFSMYVLNLWFFFYILKKVERLLFG